MRIEGVLVALGLLAACGAGRLDVVPSFVDHRTSDGFRDEWGAPCVVEHLPGDIEVWKYCVVACEESPRCRAVCHEECTVGWVVTLHSGVVLDVKEVEP